MRVTRPARRATAVIALAMAGLLAACSSSSTTGSGGAASSGGSSKQVTIGIDLTYNNTAFWAAYINYEQQDASQMHIKLLGPLLAAANASLQNQQIENLVNEGAQAIVVNPETATSLGPAISYAAAHNVQLVSVDTIVGVGHVYMVVRASNTLYGQDACAYISSKVKSGYVLDLEGDLTSSNGSQLKAIYSQWSSPDTGIIPLLKSKNLGPGSASPVILVSDDGVPFEMCDIGNGSVSASQSQPANLYAQYALTYAVDAAKGVKLAVGQTGGGAPALQNVTYQGDTNLADPIVAPFVTKAADSLALTTPVDGLPASVTTTPVTDQTLWGNV